MIYFENWIIRADGGVLARQFDNLTRTLTVAGRIPAGWEWTMLVQVGDAMDILPLEFSEDGLRAVLTAEQLAFSGHYSIQLRGKRDEMVRHSNVIRVFIPKSLSGDEKWPVLPSEFSQMERRVVKAVAEAESYTAHPPVIGENANWWVWNGDEYVDSGKPSTGLQGPQGEPGVTVLEDSAVATAKLADGAVTFAKRTPAGSFGLLWNAQFLPKFNTTAKTLTIANYSRIILGAKIYTGGMNSGDITLDLSADAGGFICYDTNTENFMVYPYTQATGIPETSILIAAYANYGKIVHMVGSYEIDGELYGVDTTVTSAKLADSAVTFAKRTPAGCMGLVWSRYGMAEFDTVAKTLKLPAYAEVTLGAVRYVLATSWDGLTLDLSSAESGTVVFDTVTKEFVVYAYDNYNVRPETLVLIAVFANYGESAWMPGAYAIDGKFHGVDTTANIPDGYITRNMLAPKLMQNQLSRCPSYTFTDMSALGINGWSDICFIGGNLWMFFPSTGEEHATADGTIRIVNRETLETVKTITHNFGHVNTCDYCKDTDCLIVGNLPGNTAYPAALYIFYNVSRWANSDTLDFATVDKTIVDMCSAFPSATAAACSWGETNFAYNNIAYVSFGYDKHFAKIVLGMGENRLTHGTYIAADADKFNGTYSVLMTSDFEPMGSGDEVVQGAAFYNGRMLTANGDEWTARASVWGFDINGNIQRELLEFPIYNANGEKNSQYKTYTEGIAVDEESGYVYQGILSGQLYAIRFYLIKYKL